MEMKIKLLLLTYFASFQFWGHSLFSVLDKHETKLKGVIYFQAIEEVYYDHLKNAYKVNFVIAVLTTYHIEYSKYSSCCKIKGKTNITVGRRGKKQILTKTPGVEEKEEEANEWLALLGVFLY